MVFSNYLNNDPTYQSLPQRVDEELLLSRVKRLRAGDKEMVNPIVISLMKIALRCVTETKSKNDELIGVAFLTLQETVIAAEKALKDDHIIPHVVTTIRERLKDTLSEENFTYRIPARTQRFMRAKGKETLFKRQSVETFDHTLQVSCQIPLIDLKEEITALARTNRQRNVVDLRIKNFTYADISAELKISIKTAAREIEELESRFSS